MMRLIRFIRFLGFYLVEIAKSNLRVARDVLTKEPQFTPCIISLNTTGLNDKQVALMANFITMTPGTLGLYVSEDLDHLYIHCMYVDGSIEAMAADLERDYGERVRHVF